MELSRELRITPESKRDFTSYKSSKWPANYDTDKDGMSDERERKVGLNPNDSKDNADDRNGDGLTNIEEFFSVLAKD